MRVRSLLWLTAIVSMIVGAVVVYLVLTVPNDLKADAMLKRARADLEANHRDQARDELAKIVQEYPRTDAAAAATVALVTLGEQERRELQAEIARVRADNDTHSQTLSTLQQTVETIKNQPPKEVIVQAPPKPKSKKTATHHRTHHRRR